MLNWPLAGQLDISSCKANWKYEVAAWQNFSRTVSIYILAWLIWETYSRNICIWRWYCRERDESFYTGYRFALWRRDSKNWVAFFFHHAGIRELLAHISDMKHNIIFSNMPPSYSIFVGVSEVVMNLHLLHDHGYFLLTLFMCLI